MLAAEREPAWPLTCTSPAPHLHLTSPAPPLPLQERLRAEVALLQDAADGIDRGNAAGGCTTAAGRANERELIAQNAQLRREVKQLRAETEQLKVDPYPIPLALGLTPTPTIAQNAQLP